MAELYALQAVVPEFAAAGATLVALTPQVTARSAEMRKNQSLGFDLLTDAGNVYAASLGLRFTLPLELQPIYRSFGIDLEKTNGDVSQTLPMPGRIVVDRHGIVRAVDVDPDYTRRPEPDATLATVRALAG